MQMINLLPWEGLLDVDNGVVVWVGVVVGSGVNSVVAIASGVEMSLVTKVVLIEMVEMVPDVEDSATKWKINSGCVIGAKFYTINSILRINLTSQFFVMVTSSIYGELHLN